ncbi:hypothetical protein N5C90_32115 [Pseudomonas aeruginosa]|uniref:hypothetical protein n=1 Tax=Pseudomonas aeruginosa TaxID=287 RepID=UPI0009A639EC|nr:hypothetical protein [Pseudomonas aeruginosa]MCO2084756.1 hypothetical protein [Pseudomonas aeruginosa]MDG9825737.1 hypothetical protein [Pseudomonas aeruginosa]MDH0406935.1 hypothetical protein [Pseudomonas aeruginosa]MDH1019380.1 hypothetical protein [Pseudomonas aeruginosa]SQC75648.1 Uncharacterised protein [Pseudomonas aeruginosa]
MSEVKRFDHVNHAHVDDCEHIENPEGAWVKASDYDALAAEAQALREEVAALRARVMVTPDASTVYAALDARERLFTSPENIRVALEAQSRLNGKTVSEGLLRLTLEFIMATNYKGSIPLGLIEELRALLNQDKENGNG